MEGSATAAITENTETAVTVNLSPTQKGSGSISYTVILPTGFTWYLRELQYIPISGSAENTVKDLAVDGWYLTGSSNLASGYYRVSLDVQGSKGDGSYVSIGRTQIAHIYDNLTTNIFMSESFSLAPISLTNTGYTDKTITIRRKGSTATAPMRMPP